MTREGCVRRDAPKRSADLGVVLLVMAACAGCAAESRSQPPLPPWVTTIQRAATLRVGLPSAKRRNLLFVCDARAPLDPPRIGTATYAPDSLDATHRRWLRRADAAAPDSAGAAAPDTLDVRAFDDSIDEEIAFERGDLDAAVFWPGELSAHMRYDARFRSPELALRARGVVACVAAAGDSLGVPRADMEALNREAFGGDLLPWSELEPETPDGAPARYSVDEALPGAKLLARVLARVARPGGTRPLKLAYLDQPVVAGGAAGEAWRTAGVTPVFAVRCPVLVRGPALPDVQRVGAQSLAGLAPCAGGTPR